MSRDKGRNTSRDKRRDMSRDDREPNSASKRAPTSKPPWSAPVALHQVPETGRPVELVPDEATRAAVAEVVGVRALPRLEASFDVVRQGRDGLHVTGRVSATVGQTCVVTLEPIENEIEEAIDLVFVPDAAAEIPEDVPPASGRSRVADEDGPEPLIGGVVDLGVIATEFLTLGIDPHPRKSGVEFTVPAAADDTPKPFAALAALKNKQGGS
jgi:Large ribosomal RNA subunit accumulation protein YceD